VASDGAEAGAVAASEQAPSARTAPSPRAERRSVRLCNGVSWCEVVVERAPGWTHATPQTSGVTGASLSSSLPSPPSMSRLSLGLLAGILYGALSAASMLPLEFPDKRAALLGAFLNRLAIGVVIGAVVRAPQVDALGLPPWVIGLATGVLLSAADAVITKAYAPILVLGALGGAVIGWVVGRFGR
jgi:hypothetical protein